MAVGTLHFRHLRDGGLLTLAGHLDDHVAQLARSFISADGDRARVREFIRLFVRPHGLDQPATPRVVDAIEAQAERRPAPRSLPLHLRPLQLGLRAVVGMRRA